MLTTYDYQKTTPPDTELPVEFHDASKMADEAAESLEERLNEISERDGDGAEGEIGYCKITPRLDDGWYRGGDFVPLVDVLIPVMAIDATASCPRAELADRLRLLADAIQFRTLAGNHLVASRLLVGERL